VVEFECCTYGASGELKLMWGLDGGIVFHRGFIGLVYFFALCFYFSFVDERAYVVDMYYSF
jgi:hypothetical protein